MKVGKQHPKAGLLLCYGALWCVLCCVLTITDQTTAGNAHALVHQGCPTKRGWMACNMDKRGGVSDAVRAHMHAGRILGLLQGPSKLNQRPRAVGAYAFAQNCTCHRTRTLGSVATCKIGIGVQSFVILQPVAAL